MAENTETTPVLLSVGDIENLVKAIDYAAAQGAYKGWDVISEVQGYRNRAVAFILSLQVQVQAHEAAQADSIVPESPAAEVAQ